MNTNLVRALSELSRICDSNSENTCEESVTDDTLEKQLEKECIDYLSYLSASDGTISECEAQFVSEYFDKHYKAIDLREYIDANHTYSRTFEQTVPKTLVRLLEEDQLLYESNPDLKYSKAKTYIDVFEMLGKEFIACDGEVSAAEIDDFTTYMNMMKNFISSKAKNISNLAGTIFTYADTYVLEDIRQDANGTEQDTSLVAHLEELDSLVGLEMVKKDVNSLIHLQEIRRIRKERGLKDIPVSNHLVFYGNPGTGKTTVARLLAKIYHEMGILSKGQFIETDRSGLVAGYVGQTAIKVKELVEKSLGGVLFIDEAYSLAYSSSESDFGREAIDALLKALEDYRDNFIVIVSGYPKLMDQFLDSNPGLRSRFNKYLLFEDYKPNELYDIFLHMCEKTGYRVPPETCEYVAIVLEQMYLHRKENFANAREVRNFFEKTMMRQADRLFFTENPTDEELVTIEIEDVMISGIEQ